MAIAPAMNPHDDDDDKAAPVDGHEHDVVMPGFRFHPTEEELIDFYLRGKVEGRRFNVELITFLDLYRYDPWELPAMATIGEKEWFFYVPRDRKYRNGDRPNRVTTSGYWKATGADRMIRGETSKPIGLKKTLVFYSGKAPKGIRSSWIMNEYRLPQNETIRTQKAEISLCRVYKRPGVEDPHHLNLPSRPSSSSRPSAADHKKHGTAHRPMASFRGLIGQPSSSSTAIDRFEEVALSSTDVADTIPQLHHDRTHGYMPLTPMTSAPVEEPESMEVYVPPCNLLTSTSYMPAATIEELNRLVGFHHQGYLHQNNNNNNQILPLAAPVTVQPQLMAEPALPSSLMGVNWEWNPIPDGRDYTDDFK